MAEVAEENFKMFCRAAEMAIKWTAREVPEIARAAKKWEEDIEKRIAAGLASEEQAYRDQMNLDAKILDVHLQKAEERGVLSRDQVLDFKEHMEKLKAAKGITECRGASFELRDILNQFKEADRAVKLGKPPKTAYRDIAKARKIALDRRIKLFNNIDQALKRTQDQLREAVAERVR